MRAGRRKDCPLRLSRSKPGLCFPLLRLRTWSRKRRRRLLGGGLVLFAAVIRGIKPASLKNQTAARADGSFDLSFSPGLFWAQSLWANSQRLGRNRLHCLKPVLAFGADVFVSRHKFANGAGKNFNRRCSSWSAPVGQIPARQYGGGPPFARRRRGENRAGCHRPRRPAPNPGGHAPQR